MLGPRGSTTAIFTACWHSKTTCLLANWISTEAAPFSHAAKATETVDRASAAMAKVLFLSSLACTLA